MSLYPHRVAAGFGSGSILAVSVLRIALILLCSSLTASGQFHVDNWTTVNGLPQNTVYSILQTRDGYLWFTTLDGLVKYDGVRFKIFNRENSGGINSNRFTSLHESPYGTLWAGTEDGGLTRYRNGSFKTYTVNDGLPHNGVWVIRDDNNGGLLVSTRSGPARLHGDQIQIENGPDGKRLPPCIDLSLAGACWYQDSQGVHRSLHGQTSDYQLPVSIRGREASTVFEAHDGAAWIAWRTGGITVLKPNGAFVLFDADANPPKLVVTSISQDRQEQIWLGTAGGGLWSFNGRQFVERLKSSEKLGTDDVRAIYEDREGTIWLGRRAAGLGKLSRQSVTVLTKQDGLSGDNVYPVLEDRSGRIWVGVWEEPLNVSSGLGQKFSSRNDLPIQSATALYEDVENRLWVGANSGQVGFIKANRWYEITRLLGQPPATIFVIKQTTDGSVWIGARNGLWRYAPGHTTRYSTQDGLPSNDIKDILEDRRGQIWFATYGGLARLEGNRFISITEADGLSSNHVRTLYEDSVGCLWIGTYDGGLNRLLDRKFTHYSTRDGLFSSGVFRIIEDSRARFWISSNRGIFQLAKSELEDFATGRVKSITSVAYGIQDGLLSTECNGGQQPAGWKTRDGHILLPTQEGLAVINPGALSQNLLAPPVVIESALLDGKQTPAGSTIRIGPGQQNLEINYTGLSFVKPEQVRFRYKLEGLDADWTEAGSRRTAYYSYLPAGSYTFRVLAANSDGLWNSVGAGISVVVIPPFYRTGWFYGLVSLSMLAIGFGIYETRLQRLRRAHAAQRAFSQQLIELQEGERKRIAAGLHDSLGQNLLVIKNRALLGLRTPPVDGATPREQLEEISHISSQALDEVREISYALHPVHMDRLGLTKSVQTLIRKVASVSNIEFTSEIANIDSFFSKESEINIYRIIQESINNIVKHSEAKKAHLLVKHENDIVEISIIDDGKGFVADAAPYLEPGLGLASISERAHMLGCKQSIQSAPGRGTTIYLKLETRGTNGKTDAHTDR